MTISRYRTRLEFRRVKLNLSYLIKILINREKITIEVFECATYIMYNQSGFRFRYLLYGYLAVIFSLLLKKIVKNVLHLVADALWFCISNL